MSVDLTWTLGATGEDEVRVYRSTSTMDPQNLPAALATLPAGTEQYSDGSVADSTTYFYRVSQFFTGGTELVSDEFEITTTSGDSPKLTKSEMVVGLVLNDDTHTSADNLVTVLSGAGVSLDNVLFIYDQSSLSGDLDFDVITIPRGSTGTTFSTNQEAAWQAGIPFLFGSAAGVTQGTNISQFPNTDADITGNVNYQANQEYIEVTNNTHYITSPFALGNMRVSPSADGSYQAALYDETFVGTALAEGDYNNVNLANKTALTVVPAGTLDLGGVDTTPAKSSFYGHWYYGQGVATTEGEQLMGRLLEWLTSPNMS